VSPRRAEDRDQYAKRSRHWQRQWKQNEVRLPSPPAGVDEELPQQRLPMWECPARSNSWDMNENALARWNQHLTAAQQPFPCHHPSFPCHHNDGHPYACLDAARLCSASACDGKTPPAWVPCLSPRRANTWSTAGQPSSKWKTAASFSGPNITFEAS